MRCKQSDEADKSGKADYRRNDKCRHQQYTKPELADTDTEHPCLTFFGRQQDDLTVEHKHNRRTDRTQNEIRNDRIQADAAETSHDPVFDRRQLTFGIGGQLERHERGLRQRMHGDAGKDDGAVFAAAVKRRKRQRDDHREQRAGKGGQCDRRRAGEKQNARRCARARAG